MNISPPFGVSWEFVFLAVSVSIATISLILQYLSQRNSVLDTEYEREDKLREDIGSEMVSIENFPEDGDLIGVSLLRPLVVEKSGFLYRIWKYLYPFGDLKGQTKLLLKIDPPDGVPIGYYAITGWSDDSNIISGNLLNKPTARPTIGIKIDSVDLIEVRSAIGELGKSDIELSRDPDEMTESIAHFPATLSDLNIELDQQ